MNSPYWKDGRLVVMVTWVDDIMVLGELEDVEQLKRDLESVFKCKSEGEVKEYVGSKINIVRKSDGLATVKFTQPVLLQKLEDDYNLPSGRAPKTPAVAGQVLVKGDGSGMVGAKDVTIYRSGTATIMYMMQWSGPEVYNCMRGLARHMSAPRLAHMEAMKYLMRYIVSTKTEGWCWPRILCGMAAENFCFGFMADPIWTMQPTQMTGGVSLVAEYSLLEFL
mmetsp:Transcript_12683/g.27423  ORF Transcript_12683/g.27423 Transcript_12683/m.27423 type:complete len:222 (-) Transcript_12683:2590-3255(-)